MAHLFPPTFDVSQVEKSEQRVIEAFVTQLDDSWYVVPSIPIVYQGKDYEIDVALVSHDHGVFLVEVKGGKVTLQDGVWKSNGKPMRRNPFDQITKAKHGLANRLQKNKVDLDGFFIQHLVAFPDIVDFPAEGAGPDAPREIVLTATELEWPSHVLTPLRHGGAIVPHNKVVALLKALKPNIEDVQVNGDFITGASQRIDKTSVNELKLLFELDENPRIYLRGRAGTGKTFLAHNWAKRALERGERTLLICFNRALGNDLHDGLIDYATSVEPAPLFLAGSYHALMNSLLGEKAPKVPSPTPPEFWVETHAQLIKENITSITERFDTVIVDEGQDFHPVWYEALGLLLSDSPTSRFYIGLDEEQAIFASPPPVEEGAVLFRLKKNVRSTKKIAEIGSQVGGAWAHNQAPPGPSVDKFIVGGKKERSKKIVQALKKITEDLDIPLSQTMVLVPHNQDIAELTGEPLDSFQLVPWEKREENTIACATIHSTKGLERLAVIVASMDDEVDPQVKYVGLTRASVYLAVIGTEKFISSISPNPPTKADPQPKTD